MGKSERKTQIVFLSAKGLITLFLIAVIVVGGSYISKKITGKHLFGFLENKEGVVNVEETQATLMEVIKRSQLYTVEYPYNGYCPVNDDDDGLVYYVYYEGRVKAGIDVTKVTLKLNEDGDHVDVSLPKVDIEEPTVDETTLDFIFRDNDYNNKNAYIDGHRCAVNDLKKQIEENGDIESAATESAKDIIKGMIESWVRAEGVKMDIDVHAYGEVK